MSFPKPEPRSRVKRRDKCAKCGSPVYRPKRGAAPRCRACFYADRRTLQDKGPCVVCGEPSNRTCRTPTCSRKCASVYRYQPKAKSCKRCGREFRVVKGTGHKKFCSSKCYYASIRESALNRPKPQCTNCGRQFRRGSAATKRSTRVFCSPECHHAFMRDELSPSWRGGVSRRRGRNWPQIAEAARVRDGRVCRMCGLSEEANGERLSVDHVRPWRDCAFEHEANALTNLVSLCRRCHSKKGHLERKWLMGDGMALVTYRRMVGLPDGGVNPPTPSNGANTLGPPYRRHKWTDEQRKAMSLAKREWWKDQSNKARMAGAADRGWETRKKIAYDAHRLEIEPLTDAGCDGPIVARWKD